MRRQIYISCFFIIGLLACQVALAQTVPLEERNVAGFVRDSLNRPVKGATVSLYSVKDTLQTATNEFGYYGFQRVKSAEFLLTVRALGYATFNRRFFNNDTRAQLNLAEIKLGEESQALDEVTIQRQGGPVVKGDTTEFWASDYIVRDYARLEDLLRRMEGITIDRDGSVFYNDKPVVKALFNNADYFQGSVQEAMKELPADLVERIQIIERDKDGLSAPESKSDETVQVMNIVTKRDRAAARMYTASGEGGTQSRFQAGGSVRFIDQADQTSVRVNFSQVPLGIRTGAVPGGGGADGSFSVSMGPGGIVSVSGSTEGITSVTLGSGGSYSVRYQRTGSGGSPGSSGSDGRRRLGSVSVGQSMRMGGMTINPEYGFNLNDTWNGTQSVSEQFYEEGNLMAARESHGTSKEQSHTLSMPLFGMSPSMRERNISVMGSLSATHRRYDRGSSSLVSQTGIINNLEESWGEQQGEATSVNFSGNTSKRFSSGLQWSNRLGASLSMNKGEEEERTDIFGGTSPGAVPDSTVHQLRDNISNSMTLTLNSSLSWTAGDFRLRLSSGGVYSYSLNDIQSRLLDGAVSTPRDDLSSYVRSNSWSVPVDATVDYTHENGLFVSPTIGVDNKQLSAVLKAGTPSIDRFDALLKTGLNMGFRSDQYGQLSVSYFSSPSQPNPSQLNPDPVYSTPYYVVIGNPDLKNSVRHNLGLRYGYNFRPIRLSVSLSSSWNQTDRTSASDRYLEIDPIANIMTTITRYVNVNGSRGRNHRLDITQTLRSMNSTIKYGGSISSSIHPYMMNGNLEERQAFSHRHNLTMFFSPVSWLEISPELRYDATEDQNSLSTYAQETYNRVFYADARVQFFLPKDFRIITDLSQSVHRTTNIMSNTSPFVMNVNVEKRIFKKRNGIINFVVMDLAKQNAFTNYHSDEQGYTNTLTNMDSRYFLLRFTWQPQFFGTSRHDTGGAVRRGDGSLVRP